MGKEQSGRARSLWSLMGSTANSEAGRSLQLPPRPSVVPDRGSVPSPPPRGVTGAPTGSVDERPRPSGARCGAGAPLPSGAAGGSGAEAEAGEVGSDPWPGGQPSPGPPSLPHPPRQGHPCQHSHRRGRRLRAGSQPPSPCASPRAPCFPSPPSPVPGSKCQKMAWPDRWELRHVFRCLTSGFVTVCLEEHGWTTDVFGVGGLIPCLACCTGAKALMQTSSVQSRS